MLMPKKNRIAIYELLFKEGVMVAKKDVHLDKHPELTEKNVPNLHVMKAMLVRGLVQMCVCVWGVGGRYFLNVSHDFVLTVGLNIRRPLMCPLVSLSVSYERALTRLYFLAKK